MIDTVQNLIKIHRVGCILLCIVSIGRETLFLAMNLIQILPFWYEQISIQSVDNFKTFNVCDYGISKGDSSIAYIISVHKIHDSCIDIDNNTF